MDDASTEFQFALIAFSSVFFVVNPFSAAPLFVTMTQDDSPEKRNQMAWRAAAAAFVTLTIFTIFGNLLLQLFSITIGAFRIAGGVLIFGIGMHMLRAERAREIQTPEEVREGMEKDDIALIPLAIPMLSGPGSISTVIVLSEQAHTWRHLVTLLGVILLTCVLSYVVLRSATRVTTLLGQTGLHILSRLMGLLLAVIAVQFILDGIRDALPGLLHQRP